MPGRGSIRDRVLRRMLMWERFKEFFMKLGDPSGRNISPWAFYDGSYFRLKMDRAVKEEVQEDIRTKNLIQRISKYHEGK